MKPMDDSCTSMMPKYLASSLSLYLLQTNLYVFIASPTFRCIDTRWALHDWGMWGWRDQEDAAWRQEQETTGLDAKERVLVQDECASLRGESCSTGFAESWGWNDLVNSADQEGDGQLVVRPQSHPTKACLGLVPLSLLKIHHFFFLPLSCCFTFSSLCIN